MKTPVLILMIGKIKNGAIAMTGKEKCEILKSIRRQIAEANNIVYMEPECHHEGDCLGTCPKCDAQIRYIDSEISRKVAYGEQITVSGISVEPFEKYVIQTTDRHEKYYSDNTDVDGEY